MTPLPAGWIQVPLAAIRADRTTALNPAAFPNEWFDLYSLPSHDRGQVEHLKGQEIGSTKKVLEPGAVVISKINPHISRVAVVKANRGHRQIGSSEWIAFSPIGGVMPEYLAHFLRQEAVRSYLATHVSGVGGSLMRTNASVIEALEIMLAPFAEQRRIVEAIESYLSRLDAAVGSVERVQAKLKAYRASVLKAAVEGRLVPTEAELARQEKRDYEPAQVLLDRILKERRRRWEEAELARIENAGKVPKDDKWKAKYEETEAPNTGQLPSLPEGWCWTTIGALITRGPQNGIYVPKARYGNGAPILRIDDYQVDSSRSSVELQRVELSSSEHAKYALAAGDLVLNRVNSMTHLGKTMVVESRHVPAVYESNMMRFAIATGVAPRFLQAYLSSACGKARLLVNAKWAVNQASINQQDVEGCPVPLPPTDEQHRILAEVDRAHTVAKAALDATRHSSTRCSRLRQSVLKWAFEGKLVDQDSRDEAAEQLLARIKAERASRPRTRRARAREEMALR